MSEQVDEKKILALTEAVEQGLERGIDVRESQSESKSGNMAALEMKPVQETPAAKKDLSTGQRVCLLVCGCMMVAAIFFFIGFYVFIYFLSKALTN